MCISYRLRSPHTPQGPCWGRSAAGPRSLWCWSDGRHWPIRFDWKQEQANFPPIVSPNWQIVITNNATTNLLCSDKQIQRLTFQTDLSRSLMMLIPGSEGFCKITLHQPVSLLWLGEKVSGLTQTPTGLISLWMMKRNREKQKREKGEDESATYNYIKTGLGWCINIFM